MSDVLKVVKSQKATFNQYAKNDVLWYGWAFNSKWCQLSNEKLKLFHLTTGQGNTIFLNWGSKDHLDSCVGAVLWHAMVLLFLQHPSFQRKETWPTAEIHTYLLRGRSLITLSKFYLILTIHPLPWTIVDILHTI